MAQNKKNTVLQKYMIIFCIIILPFAGWCNPGKIAPSEQTVLQGELAQPIINEQFADWDMSHYSWAYSVDNGNSWNNLLCPYADLNDMSAFLSICGSKTIRIRREVQPINIEIKEYAYATIHIAKPALSLTQIKDVCEGEQPETVTLKNDGKYKFKNIKWYQKPVNGSWQMEAEGEADISFAPKAQALKLGSGISYIRCVVESEFCSDIIEQNYNVKAKPKPFEIVSPFENKICSGSEITALKAEDAMNELYNIACTYTIQEKNNANSFAEIEKAGYTVLNTYTRTIEYIPELNKNTAYAVKAENECGSYITQPSSYIFFSPLNPGKALKNSITSCFSSQAELSASAPSGGSGNYKNIIWEMKKGSAWSIAGSGNSYITDNYEKPGKYEYRRAVTDLLCGTGYSDTVTVHVPYPPQSSHVLKCAVTEINYGTVPPLITAGPFMTSGDTSSAWIYEWYKQGMLIGTSGASFQETEPLRENTQYKRIVKDMHGCPYESEGIITIKVLPPLNGGEIGTSSPSACSGSSVIFSGSAPAGGDGSYEAVWEYRIDRGDWKKFNGTATSAILEKIEGSTAEARRKLISNGSEAYSNIAGVTVLTKPSVPELSATEVETCFPKQSLQTITVENPQNSAAYYFESSRNASDWYREKNGTDNFSITPSPLQEGITFIRAVAENGCGAARSEYATLKAHPSLNIGDILGQNEICYGAAEEYTALATGGSKNIYYTWKIDNNNETVTVLEGNGKTAYKLPVNAEGKITLYVTASNSNCGSVSSEKTVSIAEPLQKPAVSENQTVCFNAKPHELQVKEILKGGMGQSSYQWNISTEAGMQFKTLPGYTGMSYSPQASETDRWYTVTGTNRCGSATSDPVHIDVLEKLMPGQFEISEKEYCYGDIPPKITPSKPTGGDGTYEFKWYGRKANALGLYSIGSNEYLQVSNNSMKESWTYYREVSSHGCSPVNTEIYTLTIMPEITNNIIGENQAIKFGDTPELIEGTVAVGGGGDIIYDWYRAGKNMQYYPLDVHTRNYQPDALEETSYYKRIARTELCGEAESNIVEIRVYDKLYAGKIDIENKELNVCFEQSAGNIIMLEEPIGGEGSFMYQLQTSKTGKDKDYINVVGAVSNVYTTPAIIDTIIYYRFRVIASISEDTAYTNSIAISTYKTFKAGEIINDSIIICKNNNYFLDEIRPSRPSGGKGGYTYQWMVSKDDLNYSDILIGGSQEYYTPQMDGPFFIKRKDIDGKCGAKYTNTFKIYLADDLYAGSIQEINPICKGTRADTIKGTNGNAGILKEQYQWWIVDSVGLQNMRIIHGEKNKNCVPPFSDSSFFIIREVTNGIKGCPSKYSNRIKIEVKEALTAPTIAYDQTICEGGWSKSLNETIPYSGGGNEAKRFWEIKTDKTDWETVPYSDKPYIEGMQVFENTYIRERVESINCPAVYSNTAVIRTLSPIDGGHLIGSQQLCSFSKPSPVVLTSPKGSMNSFLFEFESSADGRVFTKRTEADTVLSFQDTVLDRDAYYRVKVTDRDGLCPAAYSDTCFVDISGEIIEGALYPMQIIYEGEEPAPIIPKRLAAGGTGDFTYSWYMKLDDTTYIHKGDGETITPEVIGEETVYIQTVSDGCTADTSFSFHTIKVIKKLSQADGHDISICNGTKPPVLTFPYPTGAVEPYDFYWEQSEDGGDTWKFAPFGLFETLRINEPLTEDAMYRRRVISEGIDTAYSNSINIYVLEPMTRPKLSIDQKVCFNEQPDPIAVSVLSEGGFGFSKYLWQVSDNLATWKQDTGTAVYQLGNMKHKTYVRLMQADSMCGIVYSDTVTVDVHPKFIRGELNAPETVSFGESALILGSEAKGGTGKHSYSFYVSYDSLTFRQIFNTDTSSYFAQHIINDRWYYRIDANGCSTDTTNTVHIRPLPKLIPDSLPEMVKICYGSTYSFEAEPAQGGEGYKLYRWMKSTDGFNFTELPAYTLSYTTQKLDTTMFYRMMVIAGRDTAYSNSTLIEVHDEIKAAAITGNQQACDDYSTKRIEVTEQFKGGGKLKESFWEISADGINYARKKESGSVFLIDGLLPTGFGNDSYFRLRNQAECGSAVSNSVFVQVADPIYNNYIEASEKYIEYGTQAGIILGSEAKGGIGSVTYKYLTRTGSSGRYEEVVNADSLKDYRPSLFYVDTEFIRVASNQCGSDTSMPVKVNVKPEFKAGAISAQKNEACIGEQVKIAGTAPAGGNTWFFFNYQISRNGTVFNDIPSADDTSFILTVTDTVYIRRKDSSQFLPPKYTNAIAVNAVPSPPVPFINNDTVFCYGDNALISVINNTSYSEIIYESPVKNGKGDHFVIENLADSIFVTITGINSHACTAVLKTLVYPEKVSADFYADANRIKRGTPVQFINTSSPNASKFEWDFSDGDGDYYTNPWHYFNHVDTFDISLTAVTGIGCTATVTKTMYIKTYPDETSISKNAVSVYPAVTDDLIFADIPDNAAINIISPDGSAVLREKGKKTISLSMLAPAVYTAEVISAEGKYFFKIIKK